MKSILKAAWGMLREQKVLRQHSQVYAFWQQQPAEKSAAPDRKDQGI